MDGKHPAEVASRTVKEVGGFIRDQRTQAQLSLRKLAGMAGVSDPYLSQVERGLRRPSADVLQRVADALEVSAETLYYKAGILAEPTDDLGARIMADPHLTEPQKRALLEVYESFRGATDGERAARRAAEAAQADADARTPDADGAGASDRPDPQSPTRP